ncbi:MAG: AAA family ATPase [Acidobacteria bacterium]|nr:AAA family ATPase [Acidobacteriota bacterium]
MRELGWRGEAFVVRLDKAKDPSDLYLQNPVEFVVSLTEALSRAEPIHIGVNFTGNVTPSVTQPAPDEPLTRGLADVVSKPLSWLWEPRIPRGKATMLEGDPGQAKSWIALAITAATTLGSVLPDGMPTDPSNVLLLTAEDDLADTVRPRLDAMGADVSRVFAIEAPIVFDDAGLFHLDAAIAEHKAALVIIDPLVAYMGAGVDIHRANATRAVMAKLAEIASRHNCAMLLIRHLSKGGTDRIIYRGLGSIDFTAACRSVLLAGSDPGEPGKRALVHIKCNVAALADSIGYKIENGAFFWTGKSDLNAHRILAARAGSNDKAALDNAEELLRGVLSEGPLASDDVKRQAKAAGIAERTLWRAKSSLGVKARKAPGLGGGWTWSMSVDGRSAADESEACHEQHPGSLGTLRSNGDSKLTYVQGLDKGGQPCQPDVHDSLPASFDGIPCEECEIREAEGLARCQKHRAGITP